MSTNVLPTGRPRTLVAGGKLVQVRRARELRLDVVHVQFPDAIADGKQLAAAVHVRTEGDA